MKYSSLKILTLLLLLWLWNIQAQGQIIIHEICSANADVIIDSQFGNFSPWLEMYNLSDQTIDVSGYYVSDDTADLSKWVIPNGTTMTGKSYLLIWCDTRSTGLHTNFSLSSEGGTIFLSNGAQTVIDHVTYPQMFTNTSYTKRTESGNDWILTDAPTPLKSNLWRSTMVQLAPPQLSMISGRYNSSISISISHPQAGAIIRYTTNGSEPTEMSDFYARAISLANTAVLKAKAFHPDFLFSETTTATYLINEHPTSLPTVSLSTSGNYLWDNTIGIYTDGTNGITGNCKFDRGVNWNQDWHRHASFEYFNEEGKVKINQDIDIRISGACSRNNPQKTLALMPKKKYGDGDFDYAFFKSKPNITDFGDLNLRNSGNDFNQLMFRDAFLQSLGIGKLDLDYLAYQPTAFYLNGQYWGIQNLREKPNKDFIASNYGIDKNDIDLIAWTIRDFLPEIEGDSSIFLDYENQLASSDINAPATFSFIDQNIDVQEYINYLITEIYIANHDWPSNNHTFWRQRSSNGKFRWILWDLDFGFVSVPPDVPTLHFATATNGPWISANDPNWPHWPNPSWATRHIRLVLSNPEFRKRFIKTMATAMNTIYNPTSINKTITQFKSLISDEMFYHKQRWGGSINDWENKTGVLTDYASQRFAFMKSYVADFFQLGSPLTFSVASVPTKAATFTLNGIDTEAFDNGAYYNGLEYTIKVNANAGWKFVGITVTTNNTVQEFSQDEINNTATGNTTVVANFVPTGALNGLVLNEVSAAKQNAIDDVGESEDYIELYNNGPESIDLRGLLVSDNLTKKGKHMLRRAEPWHLGPGQYQLLWADGQTDQGPNHLPFNLSSSGEEVGIFFPTGSDTVSIGEAKFKSLPEGYTLSRFPNATGDFILTNKPSPGELNINSDFSIVFPNPASQIVYVAVKSEDTKVEIYDSNGVIVSYTHLDLKQIASIDISHLTSGFYIIRVKDSNADVRKKLIIR